MEYTEFWKPIKGYEGKALVSNRGRVMNNYGLLLKEHRDDCNNRCVYVNGKSIRIAFAVAHSFVPNPYQLQYQGYKDGNKDNCNADNIEWVMPDFSNDAQSKPMTLIKNGECFTFESISKTAKFLGTDASRVKECANDVDRSHTFKGYYIAWSDDNKRISQLLTDYSKQIDGNNEEWKSIDGIPEIEGVYLISNKGRVRRKVFDSGNQEEYPSIVKQRSGYLYVMLSKGSWHKCCRVHRLVAQAFIPNPDNLPVVNHKDGNKSNPCADNLEWCTQSQNMIHSCYVLHSNKNGNG